MGEMLTGALAAIGVLLMLIGALGIIKMPDIYTRSHALAKAFTLGIVLLLVAAAIALGGRALLVKALLGTLFLFLTVPLGGQMVCRAAYLTGERLWRPRRDETIRDEWDRLGAAREEIAQPPFPRRTERS